MAEHFNGVKEEPQIFAGESIPSIQLLPGLEQSYQPEDTYVKKDKKPPLPLSINNFIQKTYAILQEKQFEDIVSWAESSDYFSIPKVEGDGMNGSGEGVRGKVPVVSSFRIHNLRAFEEVVLPKYFKHSNMSSFVRQVNLAKFSSTCTVSTRCEETRMRSNFSIKNLS